MESLFQTDLFLQVSGITPGRAAALLSGILCLVSIIIGRLALVRSVRRVSTGRIMGMFALSAALVGILLSVLHLARTTGGFGTGKGRAGAIVALFLGVIGMILSGVALARSRRAARSSST